MKTIEVPDDFNKHSSEWQCGYVVGYIFSHRDVSKKEEESKKREWLWDDTFDVIYDLERIRRFLHKYSHSNIINNCVCYKFFINDWFFKKIKDSNFVWAPTIGAPKELMNIPGVLGMYKDVLFIYGEPDR